MSMNNFVTDALGTRVGEHPRLLIVDDEEPVRRLLAGWLEAEGYSCSEARTAEEAWERIAAQDFALALCDLRMPGKSGIELLETIKQSSPHTAVVVVTGVDDADTGKRVTKLGAYGYIVKPAGRSEIVVSVANALGRRRLELLMAAHQRQLTEMVRRQTDSIRTSREEITLRLTAAQQYRHDELGTHVRRISLGASVLARKMNWPHEDCEMMRLAAPMHDIGKIGVPDSILLKQAKLTEEEFETMKSHTTIGGQILGGSNIPLLNLACDVAMRHHERWDGEGYPDGISGEDIPEAARIVAVLDVHDALTHDRVYRRAMPEEKALQLMREEETGHFDPRVLEAFLQGAPELREIQKEWPDEPTAADRN